MPTPKQVRFHYRKVMRLHRQLGKALNQAHAVGVIQYPPNIHAVICNNHWQTATLFNQYTEAQLAEAMKIEIMTDT